MRLVVCTPSRGSVSTGYRDTFKDLALMCAERGVDFDVFDDSTLNELHQSRNLILYRISEEMDEDDWAFWMDSDVSLNPRLVFDLMAREEKLIARAYPIKPFADMTPTWSAFPLSTGKNVLWSDDKKLIQVSSCGFGAMMMRAVVAKECREKYGVIGRGGMRGTKKSIPAFDLRINEWNTLCGEDVSFCDRWREEMDGQIWIAPDGWIQNGANGGVYLEEIQSTVGLPEGVGD